ncbi:hypothetical protein [Halorarius halobius]|uniref:hypothetical protein n=1 Tax=Halorarius halobius TaxID=2962671 RepID=UPI0020CDD523|nr:hypothetical protein [Halorarius halobius]
MSETAATDGGGPTEIFKSGFFLKSVVLVAVLVIMGLAAPPLFPDNEFLGVFVGMVWSIAFLIVAVGVVAILWSGIQQALR